MRLPILPIAQRFRSLFASCNRQSKIYNLQFLHGVLAQLVERLNGIEEVTGSNPVGSSLRSERNAKRRLPRRSKGSSSLSLISHGTSIDNFKLAHQLERLIALRYLIH